MGLFDFMKKKETTQEATPKASNPAANVNPASLESYTVKVENDQIPFHDPGVNMDVKLLVRAEFIFKGIKPDEGAVTEAAIKSFKDAFAQIDGQVPAKEFSKSANVNLLKKAMRESMIAQGFEVWSVSINWMSFNDEYKKIINDSNAQQ
ncbi:hypothetical protein B0O40_0421 [Ruminococcaceae bacterium R-25]|nr:hypothetical protein B0O40_0421 [Ruminococcaceae bacterium R-25]SUQ11056.1 hypothetical protein SAMN06297423_0421 [Oscillospiraceae bacterium]